MAYEKLREELYSYYLSGDEERGMSFAEKCFAIMDSRFREGMSVMEQKLLQYDVICEEFEPRIFYNSPFFFETGFLVSLSDGGYGAKGYGFIQANGWVFKRNRHLFKEQDEALWERRNMHHEELLYLICGEYNDTHQHFNYDNRPILQHGLKGIYERAEAELKNAKDDEEREFLHGVMHGMTSLRAMAEKYAEAAEALLPECPEEYKKNLRLIVDTARRVPWEAPKTLYEGLATLAFLRTAFGGLEGAGPNTFGRVDKDLIHLYRSDIQNGIATPEEEYELIRQFLLIWDCHYDHDMKMVGYADHELENTYTLGGCDDDGSPIYNELTRMFLLATDEDRIIFPKIKCRISKSSPREYLELISEPILKGRSTVLISNDDTLIPALVRAGKTTVEARNYIISGCWGVSTYQEKYDHGNYLNILKPFEMAVHALHDKIARIGIDIEVFDGTESFEELYAKTVRNSHKLLSARIEITRQGGMIFGNVNRYPIFSATLEGCLENHRDFTMNGGKYRDDHFLVFGLPNIVDSLMAIKTIVFDRGECTLSEYLDAVRNNWEGNEELRQMAMACSGFGDGEAASSSLAKRFNDDLYEACLSETGGYGGRVQMGHLTYTEIRWWGEKTLATPDGRPSGDYFSQGLTPSRLKRIPHVTSVINTLAELDGTKIAAGSVLNVILPSGTPLDACVAFLLSTTETAMSMLQLNCTSRETLLDAQRHPENYPDLIVRVTGFSEKFT
ncbi:MAG: hypothetical protein IJW03_01105 [Clostridia bacterium]|nr:hypothetical protein [Clostridia bacterium]